MSTVSTESPGVLLQDADGRRTATVVVGSLAVGLGLGVSVGLGLEVTRPQGLSSGHPVSLTHAFTRAELPGGSAKAASNDQGLGLSSNVHPVTSARIRRSRPEVVGGIREGLCQNLSQLRSHGSPHLDVPYSNPADLKFSCMFRKRY